MAARLSFNTERKMLYSLNRRDALVIARIEFLKKTIKRGSLAAGEQASVVGRDYGEMRNQAQHLDDNRFSFPVVDNASDRRLRNNRALMQMGEDREEYSHAEQACTGKTAAAGRWKVRYGLGSDQGNELILEKNPTRAGLEQNEDFDVG